MDGLFDNDFGRGCANADSEDETAGGGGLVGFAELGIGEIPMRIEPMGIPGDEEDGQAQVGGGIWMITSTTPPEQQAAAWDFMTWWNTLPTQVTWNLDGGSLPSIQGASEDPTLLAGMLRVILDEDLVDHEFCERWVGSLPEFHKMVRQFDLDHVALRTGVPADDIVRAARMFAAGPRGSAVCGTGPNMAPHGTLMEHLVHSFNVVCGRYPREGETVQPVTGVIGLTGPPSIPKAQVKAPMPEMLTNGAKARMRGLSAILGQAPTSALADEILEGGDGQVRGLLTVGGNPVLAWPDQIKAVRALESLDTHVALDIRISASARLADYVIPSVLSLERPDVPTNVDRWFEDPYVMYTPALLEAGPEMVDEANLYVEIARRMGLTLQLPGGDLTPDMHATPDDLLELSYPNTRVPWDELRALDGSAVLRPDLNLTVLPADPDCTAKFELVPAALPVELGEIRMELNSYGNIAGYDPHVHTHRMASRRCLLYTSPSPRD